MLQFLSNQIQKVRSSWRPLSPLSERPGDWGPSRTITGEVSTVDEALTLSPVFAALDLYQRCMSLVPLVVYRRTDQGREKARSHPAYKILHDRPNNAQPRSAFFKQLVNDYFFEGEFFAIIVWKGNNNLHSLHPIPATSVIEVKLDQDWNKTYTVRMADNTVEEIPSADMVHIVKNSKDGIRGRRLLDFAGQSLGVHKQIQDSANAYYQHSTRTAAYVKLTGGNAEAIATQAKEWNEKYGGHINSGRMPFLKDADVVAFPQTTAEEQQLITALGASVADVARWFGVSPLLLADLSRGTYSNLAADNSAFFQRSLQPLLADIQDELNLKIFGADADTYCEFLTRAIVAGDPSQEQTILNGYIQSGVMTVAEVREVLNLEPLPGTDTPMQPLNMGPVPPAQAQGGSVATDTKQPLPV